MTPQEDIEIYYSTAKDKDPCLRGLTKILDENYYLVVGDDFAFAVCPRENDPTMSQTRMIVESVCAEITRLMELRRKEDE